MNFFIIVGILSVPVLVTANLLLFHVFIRQTIKKVVRPALAIKGYVFIDYKWAGFFSCGDFKNEQMDFALFGTGILTHSIYSFISYRDWDGVKRITIKIEINCLRVDNVIFSSEI